MNNGYIYGGAFNINGKDVYIVRVIYNDPATIVFWSDGTKTVSKCITDDYTPFVGLETCVLKKLIGYEEFHYLIDDWIPEQITDTNVSSVERTLKDVRRDSYR